MTPGSPAADTIVLGRTNSRIARDLEAEVKAFRMAPGRDVLVVNSASVIQTLLRADLARRPHGGEKGVCSVIT